jgi:hypothetical protein
MPQWTSAPPPDAAGHSMRLRRTPGPGSLNAIATAPEVLGCITHYWQHRTIPCEKDRCEACANGQAWRWHGYLPSWDPRTGEHFLFEFTAQAHDAFAHYARDHLTLIGCHWSACRLGDRPNGRVTIRTKPADLGKIKLPPPPNTQAILCQIWGIATRQVETPSRLKGAPLAQVHSVDELVHTIHQHGGAPGNGKRDHAP